MRERIKESAPDTSAMSEHSINLGHCVKLQDTTVLSAKLRNMDPVIKEVIRIEIHPNNMNREDDYLSQSLKPLIRSLKGRLKHQ
jgi:hypothetical protein